MTQIICTKCKREIDGEIEAVYNYPEETNEPYCDECHRRARQESKQYSHNIMDLNLEIGMLIQDIDSGEVDSMELVKINLDKIQSALQRISNRMMGAT